MVRVAGASCRVAAGGQTYKKVLSEVGERDLVYLDVTTSLLSLSLSLLVSALPFNPIPFVNTSAAPSSEARW